MFHTEEPIYINSQGQVCKADDPDANQLLAAAHSDIPDSVAEQYGLKGGKAKNVQPGLAAVPNFPKRVASQAEAEQVQPQHNNPVLIDEDGDGVYEDTYKANEAKLGPGGIPEWDRDGQQAALDRAPDAVKPAAEKVVGKAKK